MPNSYLQRRPAHRPEPSPAASALTAGSNIVMYFHDRSYKLPGIVLRAKAGPDVTVKKEDLSINPEDVPGFHPAGDPMLAKISEDTPVFVHYCGKYVILLGRENAVKQAAETGEVKGKLITTTALKNCTV